MMMQQQDTTRWELLPSKGDHGYDVETPNAYHGGLAIGLVMTGRRHRGEDMRRVWAAVNATVGLSEEQLLSGVVEKAIALVRAGDALSEHDESCDDCLYYEQYEPCKEGERLRECCSDAWAAAVEALVVTPAAPPAVSVAVAVAVTAGVLDDDGEAD